TTSMRRNRAPRRVRSPTQGTRAGSMAGVRSAVMRCSSRAARHRSCRSASRVRREAPSKHSVASWYHLCMGALVKQNASLPVGGDGSVRLAVVADTHSHPHAKTAERLAELAPAAILHGGDIGDLEVLDQLAEVAPVYAVRGNIDVRARDLPDVLTLDVGALR